MSNNIEIERNFSDEKGKYYLQQRLFSVFFFTTDSCPKRPNFCPTIVKTGCVNVNALHLLLFRFVCRPFKVIGNYLDPDTREKQASLATYRSWQIPCSHTTYLVHTTLYCWHKTRQTLNVKPASDTCVHYIIKTQTKPYSSLNCMC